jgi:hypothetical protein
MLWEDVSMKKIFNKKRTSQTEKNFKEVKMKATQTTDWTFDFTSLPRWDNRDSMPFIYDAYYEIPQSDTLCCIYSIAEVTMCNHLGFLAILKTKAEPKLYLNVAKGLNFCDNVSVSENGRLIFLQPSMYNPNTQEIKRPILIIDMDKNAFSFFDTNNVNPCYKIVQSTPGIFKIDADDYQKKHDKKLRRLGRKKIKLNRLHWHSLDELDSVLK